MVEAVTALGSANGSRVLEAGKGPSANGAGPDNSKSTLTDFLLGLPNLDDVPLAERAGALEVQETRLHKSFPSKSSQSGSKSVPAE